MFEVEKIDNKVWIVDKGSSHLDGEPFKYRQIDKCRADALCERLNELNDAKLQLGELEIIFHNIKYGKFTYKDLEDYIYKGVTLEDIWCRHDDMAKALKEMRENGNRKRNHC